MRLCFISHKLHEVLEISHRVTVLRDGRRVNSIPTSEATRPKLAEMMVGRPVLLEYDKNPADPRDERLVLEGVSAFSNRGTVGLDNVSLRLRGGRDCRHRRRVGQWPAGIGAVHHAACGR